MRSTTPPDRIRRKLSEVKDLDKLATANRTTRRHWPSCTKGLRTIIRGLDKLARRPGTVIA